MSFHRSDGAAGRLRAGLAITLVAILAGASAAEARQTGAVHGTVTASETGEPLADVAVFVEGGGATLTDTRGRYALNGVPAGTQVVIAQRLGYGQVRRTVVVRPGETVRLDLSLAVEALAVSDIVVSVSREAERRSETAATIDVLAGEALRDIKVAHPSEVLRRIPGVWVNVTAGEGHMTAIRQPLTTQAVYLYLEDGIPIRSTGFFNHNALYEVDLPQAGRIEVLKGPVSALYGSDAIGGTINVGTRAPSLEPELEASLEGGAHGWGRLLLDASGTWGDAGLRAELNLTRTDGWRDGTAYDRQSATLRWDHALTGALRLKTVAAFSRVDQSTAGSSTLARDDYLHSPTKNYTPISYRDVRSLRISSALTRVGASSSLTLTPYVRSNRMEMIPNWSLTYDPVQSTTSHRSFGFLGRYRWDIAPDRFRLIAGVDVDYSPGDRFERAITPTSEGRTFTAYTAGAVLYDYDVTFRGISPYLQAEATPVERLRITAGLRYDDLTYDYDNLLTAGTEDPEHRRPADTRVRFTHLSPKLGATFDLGGGLNVYAAYGHGFRAPSEDQLFRQGAAEHTVDLRPVRANSYEAGVRGRIGGRITFEADVYDMTKDSDVLTFIHADGTRETMNAGETRHRGVELGLGIQATEALRLAVDYSIARHEYVHWRPKPDIDFDGHGIEVAPRDLGNVVLSWAPDFLGGGEAAAEWSHVGRYWMDPENTHEYPGHDVFTLRARQPVYGGITVFARISNLLNERYAERAIYTAFNGEEFAPGMPRTLYIGVEYH
ncbi:MAG TPA: TonB-dependent receptor [Longimicrobiales bacterium]